MTAAPDPVAAAEAAFAAALERLALPSREFAALVQHAIRDRMVADFFNAKQESR